MPALPRLLLAMLLACSVMSDANAQYTSGDIRSLSTADATWTFNRFTARCVSPTGECYVQSARFSQLVNVYADVAAFQAGAAPVRTVTFTGMADTGGQMIWVNGTIYGAVTGAGAPLGRWDPMTGVPIPTSLTAGSTSIQWGGGLVVLLGMDGNYIYVAKDATLEVYDLSESLIATHAVPSLSTLTTGFAAGGYWYPVDYNGLGGQCDIFDRYNALTGASSPWPDTLAGGCPYLTSAHFDPFFNRLLHTNGNPSTCQDTTFLYNDVLMVSPQVRTVDAADAMVVAGQTGRAVTMTAENVGPNSIDVTLVALSFTDTMAMDVGGDYSVTPSPTNPTSIAAGATEVFDFLVDVLPGATVGTITLDGRIEATDSVTMAAYVDSDADTTDTWDVTACLAPDCGDCNGDMTLSILDALVAAQHSAALITLTGIDFSNCNVLGALEPDPAAEVSILDALALAQAAAGLTVMLVCC